jgi:hypothetical protein
MPKARAFATAAAELEQEGALAYGQAQPASPRYAWRMRASCSNDFASPDNVIAPELNDLRVARGFERERARSARRAGWSHAAATKCRGRFRRFRNHFRSVRGAGCAHVLPVRRGHQHLDCSGENADREDESQRCLESIFLQVRHVDRSNGRISRADSPRARADGRPAALARAPRSLQRYSGRTRKTGKATCSS